MCLKIHSRGAGRAAQLVENLSKVHGALAASLASGNLGSTGNSSKAALPGGDFPWRSGLLSSILSDSLLN